METAGIPTVCLTSALSITESVGVPRGVFLDFPLGHTAGKKHDRSLQRNILIEALAAFEEIQTPGEIKRLPYSWSKDESWRERPLGGGSGEKTAAPSDDFRTSRDPRPQYQHPDDEMAFDRDHQGGACGTCIGAE